MPFKKSTIFPDRRKLAIGEEIMSVKLDSNSLGTNYCLKFYIYIFHSKLVFQNDIYEIISEVLFKNSLGNLK
jgi:hypothetical protein